MICCSLIKRGARSAAWGSSCFSRPLPSPSVWPTAKAAVLLTTARSWDAIGDPGLSTGANIFNNFPFSFNTSWFLSYIRPIHAQQLRWGIVFWIPGLGMASLTWRTSTRPCVPMATMDSQTLTPTLTRLRDYGVINVVKLTSIWCIAWAQCGSILAELSRQHISGTPKWKWTQPSVRLYE